MDSSSDLSQTAERKTSPHAEPGARWLRCGSARTHPVRPGEAFRRGHPGRDRGPGRSPTQRDSPAIAENFVAACRAADHGQGVDLVALTDHNSIEGYRRLRPQFQSIADRARDEGKTMPAILPWRRVQRWRRTPPSLSHRVRVQHSPRRVSNPSSAMSSANGSAFDPKFGTPRATGQSVGTFLEKLYKYAKPATGERDLRFVLLPAHADGGPRSCKRVRRPQT